MADLDEDFNPYDILGIELSALEKDVKKAYRTKSITVHPDKNPSPDAAQKFFELTQAYEYLLDPIRRTALDAKIKIKEARKLRYSAYDAKRKAMMDELDGREKDFKKAKVTERQEKDARKREEERIKEEGRRMMRERGEAIFKARQEQAGGSKMKESESKSMSENLKGAPPAGPLDTTVRLKYSLNSQPSLNTATALASLFASFGTLDADSVVFSIKPNKKHPNKPGKNVTALVPFKDIGDAFAAVMASGRRDTNIEGVEVGWAAGSEPELVQWLKTKGELRNDGKKVPEAQPVVGDNRESEGPDAFSSFPDVSQSFDSGPGSMDGGVDFESLTLMRMRQAERERLELEILEQDAAEGLL